MERQLVVFTLAGEYYGVDIFLVERIIDMQPIANVPHAPAFVMGVTNVSGLVVPVLDLRQRFALPALMSNHDCRMVVVSVDGSTVGIVVDTVEEVLHISDSNIVHPPDTPTIQEASLLPHLSNSAQYRQ